MNSVFISGQDRARTYLVGQLEDRRWEEGDIVLMLDNIENGRAEDLVPNQANIVSGLHMPLADDFS